MRGTSGREPHIPYQIPNMPLHGTAGRRVKEYGSTERVSKKEA